MMLPPDHHTHNAMCHHADGNLEDYVRAAIIKGLEGLGFNDHFPQWYMPPGPPYNTYSMDRAELSVYFQTARQLREKYKNQIPLKIGMEVDYTCCTPDCKHVLKPELAIWPFDYIYGSVHVVTVDGETWTVDDEVYMNKWDKGHNDAFFEDYWLNVHAAIKSGLFDIIGHLDLPKKFAKVPEHPDRIAPLVDEAIELLAKWKVATEINTSGWYKPVAEQYPSQDILKKLARAGVGIVLGSDAHKPELVGRDFPRAITLLRDAGFEEVCEFSKRKCKKVPLSKDGT